MENLQTMSLGDKDSGMTPINMETKNNDPIVQQTEMDSTPLNEVMGDNEIMGASDPRAMQQMPAQMYAAQQQQQQQVGPAQQQVSVSSYPMNLTDEQVVAILAGIVAIGSFSRPVQEKLSSVVPQFLADNGTRSTIGLVSTGALAAVAFYFGKRMLK